MSSIYCLYASREGRPRYIGQTTKPVAVRLDQHLRAARRGEATPLSRWIRDTLAAGDAVQAHLLQTDVPPADLDLFETYWIRQFANLLNANRGMQQRRADSAVARALHGALRAIAMR